jgi:hypothetical protein
MRQGRPKGEVFGTGAAASRKRKEPPPETKANGTGSSAATAAATAKRSRPTPVASTPTARALAAAAAGPGQSKLSFGRPIASAALPASQSVATTAVKPVPAARQVIDLIDDGAAGSSPIKLAARKSAAAASPIRTDSSAAAATAAAPAAVPGAAASSGPVLPDADCQYIPTPSPALCCTGLTSAVVRVCMCGWMGGVHGCSRSVARNVHSD